MHGMAGGGGSNKVDEAAIMQLADLVMGTSSLGKLKPIIGPPMM